MRTTQASDDGHLERRLRALWQPTDEPSQTWIDSVMQSLDAQTGPERQTAVIGIGHWMAGGAIFLLLAVWFWERFLAGVSGSALAATLERGFEVIHALLVALGWWTLPLVSPFWLGAGGAVCTLATAAFLWALGGDEPMRFAGDPKRGAQ